MSCNCNCGRDICCKCGQVLPKKPHWEIKRTIHYCQLMDDQGYNTITIVHSYDKAFLLAQRIANMLNNGPETF